MIQPSSTPALAVPIAQQALSWLPGQTLFGQAINVAAIELPDLVLVTDGPSANAATIETLRALGKPVLIHLSHGPSFNDGDAFVRALGAEIFLHEKDRRNFWLGRNRLFCRFWSGERHLVAPGVQAIHIGGHSAGHDVLHVATHGGLLFTGDTIKVGADGRIAWDRDVVRRLGDPGYARYLADQIMSVPFDTAVSLHGGIIRDAGRHIAVLLET